MVIERSDGNWGSKIIIFQTKGEKPSKQTTMEWFLEKLVDNIDSIPLQDDMAKAVADGDLTSADVDVIIEHACAERERIKYDNITRLLAGKTSGMQYNYGSGQYEQKPPMGWGQ